MGYKIDEHWRGDGGVTGAFPDVMPPLKEGMIIGVDVDNDAGTISYWVDGKKVTTMRDYMGKYVSVKDKKVFPAVSVFGRNTCMVDQSSIMEVRAGLDPPALT